MTSPTTSADTCAAAAIRKIITHAEDVYAEGGRRLETPLRKTVVCAVIRNPWDGEEFVDDLWPEMNRIGALLAPLLAERIIELFGDADRVLGLGKCAIVGVAGEVEHGAGIIHGPEFGPRFRALLRGVSPIPFTERRGGPGVSVGIPTAHKIERAARAFYQAVDLTIDDAPHPDEIAIAIATVSGPRPHERVGDLKTDAEWAARR